MMSFKFLILVLISFPVVVIKYLDKFNLREKRFILAPSVGCCPPYLGSRTAGA